MSGTEHTGDHLSEGASGHESGHGSGHGSGTFDPTVEIAPIQVPTGSMAAGASPELVQAFRMNAEALHRLQDMQEQLVTAVQRSNRSEMMMQSTQSLNETFRNLTQVQRSLLDRMDKSAQRGPNRLVPLMLLGLLIVLVGGVAVIVESVRQRGSSTPVDQAQLAEQVRSTYERGLAEGATGRDDDLTRMRETLSQADARVIEFQQALDDSAREQQELERNGQMLEMTNRELAKEVSMGRQALLAKRVLERKFEEVELEKAATDRIIARHEDSVDRVRKINQKLRMRLADVGFDIVDDPSYDPVHDPYPEISDRKMRPIHPPNTPRVKINGGAAANGAQAPTNQRTGMQRTNAANGRSPTGRRPAAPIGLPGAVPPPPMVRRTSGSGSDTRGAGSKTGSRPAALRPSRGPAIRGSGELGGSSTLAARSGPLANPTPASNGDDLVRRDDRVDSSKAVVKQVRTRLNELLERSRDSSGALYQVTHLRGVSSTRLAGLRLMRYDDVRGIPEIVTADDVRIIADRSRQEVVLHLRNGKRIGQNRSERIPTQGARITIARGAEAAAWIQSGLTMIEIR